MESSLEFRYVSEIQAIFMALDSMNIADERTKITTGNAMFVSNTTTARLCQSAAQEEN